MLSRILVAVVAVGAALVAGAPGAQAAFDANHDERCEWATNVTLRGTTTQDVLHEALVNYSPRSLGTVPIDGRGFGYKAPGCEAFKLPSEGGYRTIEYQPATDDEAKRVVGAVTGPTAGLDDRPLVDERLGGAGIDQAPTAAEIANARAGRLTDDGGAPLTSDDTILHTIPLAQVAVAIAVALPEGCMVADADRRLTRAQLEGAFAADPAHDQWKELFGAAILETPNSPLDPGQCGELRFARVGNKVTARGAADADGITLALRHYLQGAAAASGSGRDWRTPEQGGTLPLTRWPNESANPVLRAADFGSRAMGDAVAGPVASDVGAIGFGALNELRPAGPNARIRSSEFDWWSDRTDQRTFFVRVQALDDDELVSPAKDLVKIPAPSSPTGSIPPARGANCSASYTGVPAATTDSWSGVAADAASAGYPICALTYALVFQAARRANLTQGVARPTKDYLTWAVRDSPTSGQAMMSTGNYSRLPKSISAIALAGANALTF